MNFFENDSALHFYILNERKEEDFPYEDKEETIALSPHAHLAADDTGCADGQPLCIPLLLVRCASVRLSLEALLWFPGLWRLSSF